MSTEQVTELHLRQLTNVLRRRWKLIMAAALSAAALAGVIGLVVPPRYTGKAQVVIDPQRWGNVGGQASTAGMLDDAAVESQVAALISDNHLQRVLDSLVGELGPEKTQSRGIFGTKPLDMDSLKRQINAFKEHRSRVIGVTYTSTNPSMAAAVANRTVELYLTALLERNRADRNDALNSLRERIPVVRTEVARADAALQNYRTLHGFTEVNRADAVDQQLIDLNHQLAIASSDLAERHARLTSLRDLLHRKDGTALLIDALNDATLKELYREEVVLRSRTRQAGLPSENQPNLNAGDSHWRELRTKIEQSANQNLGQLADEKEILETRVRYLQQRLAILQDASTKAREHELRLRELQREATASTQLYESLLQRQKAMLEERDVQPELRVLSFASIPHRPSSPNPILFVLPAVVVASMAAGLLAIVLERLDGTMRTERDINNALGIPCIGAVPQLTHLRRHRPHQFLLQNAPYTEAIRSIVAEALQLTDVQKIPKTFLVTSSVPSEGKTALAVSFAVYAALLHRRVLLIDFAFRHPAIVSELGEAAEGGLLHVLQGRPLAELIKAAPKLGVDYLPLPRNPVDPVAILANERIPDLLRQLKERYDCVVIDCAPLLGTTEARLLAPMVDKILFAVKWGSTRREVAQNALRLLRYKDSDLRDLTSAVITQVDLKRHARYHYGDFGESLLHVKAYPARALSPQRS
jgi:polysaccharide biosynthesis transport protein